MEFRHFGGVQGWGTVLLALASCLVLTKNDGPSALPGGTKVTTFKNWWAFRVESCVSFSAMVLQTYSAC